METYTLPHFPPSVNTVHIALFEDVSNAPAIRKRLIQAATTDGEEGDRLKAEVDFGFLDGRMLVSKSHLLTAIQTTLLNALTPAVIPSSASGSASGCASRSGSSTPNPNPALALIAQTTPQLLTRSHNIHSELLLTLSPNNNITESIRRHGLSDQTTSLVVVRMGGPPGGSKRSEDSKHTEDSDDPNGERQGEGSSQAVWKEMEEVVNGRLVVLDQLDREDHPDWARVDKVYKLAEMNQLKLPGLRQRKIDAVINAVAIKSVT